MMTSTRAQYRELIAQVAERARQILPASVNGRIEKAMALVLMGDVQPQADGTVTVYSATDATRRYVLQGTSCTCQDFERGQAPEGWCRHRIAAGIAKRVGELLPQSTSVLTESAQPLPEARASINVRLVIAGRDCQLTLRDSDETRLLVRLAEVLQRFPLPEVPCDPKGPAPRAEGWCQKHGVQMKWNEGKEGRKGWFSHRDAAGAWCKGK